MQRSLSLYDAVELGNKKHGKKKSKQTKPPEYCKEKEISLILESLE